MLSFQYVPLSLSYNIDMKLYCLLCPISVIWRFKPVVKYYLSSSDDQRNRDPANVIFHPSSQHSELLMRIDYNSVERMWHGFQSVCRQCHDGRRHVCSTIM